MADIDFRKTALSKSEVKFISTFLRFEFALKESGFGPENGPAQVDWDRVANVLGQDFFRDIQESGLTKTILNRPPKKQVTRDHQLDWEDQDPPRNVCDLISGIRRVRNNLLHGGKSGDPESDSGNPTRSITLISEAQWVVEQALQRLGQVRVHFEGKY